MKKAIAVFDIGKTNKKFLLFGEGYDVLLEEEVKFPEIEDEDGFLCDDIEKIEKWIFELLRKIIPDIGYDISDINISTYGASLAYLDSNGKRCTPIYNYLKPMPEETKEKFIKKYNSDGDFFRKTASPDLGLLNSGLQLFWLKEQKPALFGKVKSILHLPQYISYLLSGEITSEHTSIGCHTAMWDYDNFNYHHWLKNENILLPRPVPNNTVFSISKFGKPVNVGAGIHDSSASLVPYLKTGEEFILISSGTWCINMNPFNSDPLTGEELYKDCLCYLSTQQKQVKSSRLFMGHYHDGNLKRLNNFFNVPDKAFKNVIPDNSKLEKWRNEKKRIFFNSVLASDGIDNSVDLNLLKDFNEAYNRLMFDLTMLEIEALNLVIPKEDKSKNVYISGGFANNNIFTGLLASYFPCKNVYVSEINNSSALGAAMVIGPVRDNFDLGLKKIEVLF